MKKGMFTGWKDVLNFTFVQNTKTKTFKASLIGIAILIFIIFFSINVIMGYVSDNGNKKKGVVNKVDNISIINNIGIDDELLEKFKETYEYIAKSDITVYDNKKVSEVVEGVEKNTIVINLYKGEADEDKNIQYMLDVYATKDLSKKNVKKVVKEFSNYFDEIKYNLTSLEPEAMRIITSEYSVYSVDVNDKDESFGVIIARIFVPMMFVLLIYFMVLMYGQSISKSLIVEKNSKLMEMLLTSVKPHAIVLGKILAMYLNAIMQMGIWIISGVAGFIVGDKVAKNMFSNYDNAIVKVIRLLKEDSASAFSISAVIIGVLAIFVGFLLYCVFAALVASNITKAEELANGMSIFQMVTVAGFLGAYMLPLLQAESPIVDILRYIPVTSPFMLTSDVIIGNIGIAGACVSLLIMIGTTIVMIILTGKNYKKKVF
ncbi:MAG: ABC transporter permease [Lachnospiraceae bacterium]|nr:ABC transporter permease [Clostridiales bacterium]MDD6292894.1 ABC transporter permease [Eubacteriales bacterium]MDY2607045.1 ABC transporter permease [Lachnospiraceae bacterium]